MGEQQDKPTITFSLSRVREIINIVSTSGVPLVVTLLLGGYIFADQLGWVPESPIARHAREAAAFQIASRRADRATDELLRRLLQAAATTCALQAKTMKDIETCYKALTMPRDELLPKGGDKDE
jgi:hypothetical protein